jgi:hypothetical protein
MSLVRWKKLDRWLGLNPFSTGFHIRTLSRQCISMATFLLLENGDWLAVAVES